VRTGKRRNKRRKNVATLCLDVPRVWVGRCQNGGRAAHPCDDSTEDTLGQASRQVEHLKSCRIGKLVVRIMKKPRRENECAGEPLRKDEQSAENGTFQPLPHGPRRTNFGRGCQLSDANWGVFSTRVVDLSDVRE